MNTPKLGKDLGQVQAATLELPDGVISGEQVREGHQIMDAIRADPLDAIRAGAVQEPTDPLPGMSKLAALHQAAQQSEHLGAIRALEWYYQIALELAKEPGAEISALLIIGERLQEKINARYDE